MSLIADTYNTAIDPTWETWSKVQTAFLEKQRDLYGGWTAHYYSVDLYTTLEPPSYSPDYLRANTRFVIDSLRQVDPQAVWVMSGGIFINKSDTWTPDAIEGLLSGAEDDEMASDGVSIMIDDRSCLISLRKRCLRGTAPTPFSASGGYGTP